MVTTVGNLSAKGVCFYRDKEMRTEIPQNAILDVGTGRDIEFYIGVRHRVDNVGRMGKILSLEENYKIYLLDMIQEVDGNYFRNYDNVESMSVTGEFDTKNFIKNLLEGMLDEELFNVLNFISIPHMGKGNAKKIFQKCMAEPSRSRFVDCDAEKDFPIYRVPPPVGYWTKGEWCPEDYYKFVTDFFVDPKERDRRSIWDQQKTNHYIRAGYTHQYLESGFNANGNNYNYVNNVYPEQTELLDYRWRNGGFDITIPEYRAKRGDVFNRLKKWYSGGKNMGHTGIFRFQADERTVYGFTGIGKVELRPIYDRDKHVLENLLGPLSCVGKDTNNNCTLLGYGGRWETTEDEKQNILFNINNPDGTIPDNVDSQGIFNILYASTVENMTFDEVQSSSVYNILKFHGPDAIEGMYIIDNHMGMVGGQKIFDKGLGNEFRYFQTFRSFLDEQEWTLDDFMDIYSKLINERAAELEKSLSFIGEKVRVRDYSEFYDKDRKSPFDGIEHYIPIPLTLGSDNSTITVSKKKVDVSQDGTETISNVGDEVLSTNQFTLGVDKDEFIGSVSINACSVLISDFMRFRVKIKFKNDYATLDSTKLRIFTSDFTYMNEREYKVR